MSISKSSFAKDKLYKLQSQNETNKKCADCNNKGANYIDVLYGCFLCTTCAGIHRGLGTDISRIKSMSLDKFTDAEIKLVEDIGSNINFNNIYEATYKNKKSNMSENELKLFISQKYQCKKFTVDVKKPTEIKEIKLIDI